MNITGTERITYEYKNYSDWWDHPRGRKDLPILRIKKRSLSLMSWC
jgi:hypothetical protein